ncbi:MULTISPECIES: hypothetical protein [Brucella]|uniref:hypothetical protein n=1 Tax=Brucella TaxID=234 RepID=UPI00124EA089|nr:MULTISPECIES: hypothetical protein [Brucella/Ochrobactrum group]KAB2682947.1 hypothetical protein F9K78_08380 [Brucella pseudintermedia]MBA8843694.1 DNA-binding MarR family transcriptional regulator [Ochrobactrum sp. RH1CCR137]MBA8858117.1 DNA-binding MarR family transcriptional regulator [Ochrobactrum sp. RH1CCR134]WGG61446.1 hypothetical protein QA414_22470 [Brucella intermedia]
MTELKNHHNDARLAPRGIPRTLQSAEAIAQSLKARLTKDFSDEREEQFSELLARLEQAEKKDLS